MLSDYFKERNLSYLELSPDLSLPAHFGDWQKEYWAVRHFAGLFDFSFMHTLEIKGANALVALNAFQCRPLDDQILGTIRYSFLVDRESKTSLDITVWRIAADHFWLIAGRSIHDEFTQFACQYKNLQISDRSAQYSIFAIQGPNSNTCLSKLFGEQGGLLPNYFTYLDIPYAASSIRVARIGYTGELGYELVVPNTIAKNVWLQLLAMNPELMECGFIAANTLRIEAGYLLFTNELLEARCLQALNFQRFCHGVAAPVYESMIGCRFAEAQEGLDLAYSADLEHFVSVTSRCYSPRLGCEIGIGFYNPGAGIADKKKALTRELEPVEIMKLPFYRNDKP